MSNRSVTISRTPTDRPDYFVKTSVWYNESQRNRGYWCTVVIVKSDGPMEMSLLISNVGKRSFLLEPAKRFSEKQFNNIRLALTIGNAFPDVEEAFQAVLAEASQVTI